MKNVRFIFIANQNCQFYLHCCRSKLTVLFLMSQIKIASFLLLKIKNASFICFVAEEKLSVLSLLSQIKIASFSLLKIKIPVLSVLWQIKGASFIFIVTYQTWPVFILNVTDQNCQLFNVEDKNVSFICFVADKRCQIYLYCHRSKLPVIHIVTVQNWPVLY